MDGVEVNGVEATQDSGGVATAGDSADGGRARGEDGRFQSEKSFASQIVESVLGSKRGDSEGGEGEGAQIDDDAAVSGLGGDDAGNGKNQAADEFTADLLSRAEKANLTEYEAREYGDAKKLLEALPGLEAKIAAASQTRRTDNVAGQSGDQRGNQRQDGGKKDQQTGAGPESLSKLKDLEPADWGDDLAARDKIYRGELQRLHEQNQQMLQRLQVLDGLSEFVQQETTRRREEASRAAEKLIDDFVDSLGDEFRPIFGKGRVGELSDGSPYLRTRGKLDAIAMKLAEEMPDLEPSELLSRAAQFLYPKQFERRAERLRAETVKKQSAARQGSGGSRISEERYDPEKEPFVKHPVIQAAIRKARSEEAGM